MTSTIPAGIGIEQSRRTTHLATDAAHDYLASTQQPPGSSLEVSISNVTTFTHPQPFTNYAAVEGHYASKGQLTKPIALFVKEFSPSEERDETWGGYLSQSDPEKQALTYELFGGVNRLPKLLFKRIRDGKGYFVLENVGNTTLEREILAQESQTERRKLLIAAIMEIKNFQQQAQYKYLNLETNRENAAKLTRVFKQRTMGERFQDYMRGLGLRMTNGEKHRATAAYKTLFEGIDREVAINHGDINLLNITKDNEGKYHLTDPKLKKGSRFHDLANLIACPLEIGYKDWRLYAEAFELGPGKIEILQKQKQGQGIRRRAVKIVDETKQFYAANPQEREAMTRDITLLVLHYSLRRLSKDADFKRRFSETATDLAHANRLFATSDLVMANKINTALSHTQFNATKLPLEKRTAFETIETITRKAIRQYMLSRLRF